MDNFHIQPIPLKEIYISVLKEKRVTNEDGWTRKVPVGYELAEKMGVSTTELSGAIHILTGLRLPEFIIHYRSIQAQEYLACTDLPPKEIARRCGFTHYNSFHKMFKRLTGMCVLPFRKKYRPANYRELYGWE